MTPEWLSETAKRSPRRESHQASSASPTTKSDEQQES